MNRTLLIAAGLVVCASVPPRAVQESGQGDLVHLEQRLQSDADDLEAANAYRRAVIRMGEYDRALRFFGRLVTAHPRAANAHLNYGFAYVDKIPAAGAITQVILANSALTQFTRAIELQPTWIALYTRGASYLFWPRIFGRAPLGVADLEDALRLQRTQPKRSYHVRTFVTLGDGYWKVDDPRRARATWQQGLREFPDHEPLQARLQADPATLAAIIEQAFDPAKRVDTDLSDLWSDR
jgi:tetratricopeptide (TPR) repeat protein